MSVSGNVARKRSPPENQSSILLHKDENEIVFGLLGNKCQSLATAVVQIYLSEQPSHMRWQKKLCGVACFVKDNIKKSYFIRIFNMDEYILSWEQELYTQCVYKTPRPYFHTFEAETCQAGLNFADEQEAMMFENVIQDRLCKRMQRIDKKKTQVHSKPALPTPNMQISEVLPDLPVPPVSSQGKISGFGTLRSKKKEKKKDKKLTKADIGEPTNFQHVTHVGWDPTKGLDGFQKDNDPYLQKLFNMVGISEKQLQDEDTRKFIYEFIDSSGMGDVLRELSSADKTDDTSVPPPVPARQPQQTTPLPSRVPPPAPPARLVVPPPPPSISTANNKPKTSPVISRQMAGPPPPPPPTRALPQIPTSPAPPSRSPSMRSGSLAPPPPPPPPPSGGGNLGQLPPPPPSMISGNAAPPPPPPPPIPLVLEDVGDAPVMAAEAPDGRTALLQDIRGGLSLKPVQREASNRSSGDSRSELLDQIRHGIELKSVKDSESDLNPQMDMRSQLLNQIREGVQLKSVSESEKSTVRLSTRDRLLSDIRKGVSLKHVETRVGDNPRPASQQQGVLDGMASALAKALADRSRAIHSSDDSGDDDDDDDDDDEWDD